MPRDPLDFNLALFNVDSFLSNYNANLISRRSAEKWGVKFNYKNILEDYKLLCKDVDPSSNNTNTLLSHSSDEGWLKFPLILDGPWVCGWTNDNVIRRGLILLVKDMLHMIICSTILHGRFRGPKDLRRSIRRRRWKDSAASPI